MAGVVVYGTYGSVRAWGLAFFNLLLSVPVQEVSPRCLLPPQGLSSLRAVGVRQAASCRQAQEPLFWHVGCQVCPGTWVTWALPHAGPEE